MLNFHLLRNANTMPKTMPASNVDPARDAGIKHNLSRVKPGQQVVITGFERLSATYRQHLQAYGLLPGRQVTVLAQNPVTIVLVEQTELAFETEIARQVNVEAAFASL